MLLDSIPDDITTLKSCQEAPTVEGRSEVVGCSVLERGVDLPPVDGAENGEEKSRAEHYHADDREHLSPPLPRRMTGLPGRMTGRWL